jgi:hypothetical protein
MYFVSHHFSYGNGWCNEYNDTEGEKKKEKEIAWGISQQLEDLDFSDDIYMLSRTFNKMYI